VDIVRLLKEAGANLQYTKQGSGMTPLHWAAYNNDEAVVQYLLSNGCPLLENSQNLTPIDIAGISD